MARFYAVALKHDQYEKLSGIESALIDAVSTAMLKGAKAILLACDKLSGPIHGFDGYSNVFFFNEPAWYACLSAGFDLHATRMIESSGIPAQYILLAGPHSAAATERDLG